MKKKKDLFSSSIKFGKEYGNHTMIIYGKEWQEKIILYINSINDNFEEFIKKYKDIKDYFSWALQKQKELIQIASEKNAIVNAKRDKVTYLN